MALCTAASTTLTASFLSVFLTQLSMAAGGIIVLTKNNETFRELNYEPAGFGPRVPKTGIWGYLQEVSPSDACTSVKPPANTSLPFIALIRRNNCNFDLKVFYAQKAGFVAAIVRNVGSDKLVPMQGGKYASKVNISSVFITEQDGIWLEALIRERPKYDFSILIDDILELDPLIYLIPFAIVVGICFTVMVVFVIVKWVLSVRRKRRSRLSKANLNKIPVKKFKKGDPYDICAVCLDEYEDGEKLRILPCSHGYHQKCIDPWLTKNKRTCPLCKKKVIPGNPEMSSSDEDESDTEAGNSGASETAPLLGSTSRNQRRTTGNTFDSQAVPAAMRRDTRRPGSDSSSYASSSDESFEPSTSMHQSSAEVHQSSTLCPEISQNDHASLGSPSSSDYRALAQQDDEKLQTRSRSSTDGSEEGAVGGVNNPTFELVEDHFKSDDSLEVHGPYDGQLEVQTIGNIQDGEFEGSSKSKRKRVIPV